MFYFMHLGHYSEKGLIGMTRCQMGPWCQKGKIPERWSLVMDKSLWGQQAHGVAGGGEEEGA